jgi:hypothetical protein
MAKSKSVSTPMIPNIKLSADDPIDNSMMHHMTINGLNVSYTSVVRSLVYAMMGTRPDIAFLVGVLNQYSANPKKCHWEMVKCGLRYLKETQNLELSFQEEPNRRGLTFHGFSDADWSGDGDTSRSTSGYAFICCKGAICWSSK